MNTTADDILIEQLKAGDRTASTALYQQYFPMVAIYVQQNSGNQADAEDIFQETLLVLLQQIQKPGFVLSSSLKTFVYAIARNLWCKRLRDNRVFLPGDDAVPEQSCTAELFPEKPATDNINGWLDRITYNCKRILKALFFYQQPMALLARRMGWKNKHTADNQKYKCLQQLRKVATQR
ncbi:RNA polymerase sigma factor [Chitinophaga sp. HK235]|uniref:RNA polymerase sigma factor n=1 Tax=Chitinophaga sp. HK235 TaxID=2952571 RepID=UPI001BA50A37|nr:sigma-70 family RNA polymerase sigma factor [Chitinophaga sp. HK235]